MALKPGANIDRLVQVNEQYHQAKVYDEKSKEALLVGKWHEKQYRVKNCATQMIQERKKYQVESHGTGEMDSAQEMALELKTAAATLVLQRRAKLKSLYEMEALQFERELNSLGLAVAKSRT